MWISGLLGLLGNSQLDLSLGSRDKNPVVYNVPEKKNNTPLIVFSSIGVLLLITALVLIFKAKKA